MYQVGNQVLYGVHGICSIAGIETMRFGKTRGKYYCLQPIAQPDARYYVPVDNEAAVAKLRPLMSKDALMELLHSEQVCKDAWIPEENQRKLRYRELLTGGDITDILQMICTLYRHKKTLIQSGRKFHQCDESFLKDAERMLNAEFAQVLDLEQGKVREFIMQELGIEEI